MSNCEVIARAMCDHGSCEICDENCLLFKKAQKVQHALDAANKNKYNFPIYPGDEVWFLVTIGGNPIYCRSDIVQMVGFTTRSIQIKLRSHKDFNKTYTWGKNVFKTKEEAEDAIKKIKEKL